MFAAGNLISLANNVPMYLFDNIKYDLGDKKLKVFTSLVTPQLCSYSPSILQALIKVEV